MLINQMPFWSWPTIKPFQVQPHQLHLWWCILPPTAAATLKHYRPALVRKILNLYLPASELCMAKTAQGKPYLTQDPLRFNLSHSQNYMLLGIQASKDLGLDIECLHPRDFKTFAQRFWGEAWYQEQFAQLPSYLHMLSFYHAWTQTEAWIKYHGASVFRHPSFAPQCLPLPQTRQIDNLALRTFMLAPQIIASVCTQQSIQDICFNQLNLQQEDQLQHFLQPG